ncbi:type IV toxin-antitoxin system AbiEi family antitoxin domain-containing protein [Hyphomicrobium sp.]|uniref:type IV toxin-antitoxin system AbiEi family antitoxin domain-containing protein n=1 Tax=Hyphomicrobium sp. TaxID=82 RepID=UPI003F7276D5
MSEQKDERLKSLLQTVPPGFLVDSRWLAARKIRRSSVHDYAKRGWLEHVTHGLYRRPTHTEAAAGSELQDWRILVLSLQKVMDYSIHVGGMTALQQRGYSHYLRLGGSEPVFLYGERIPSWIKKAPTSARLSLRSLKLFDGSTLGVDREPNFEAETPSTLTPWWNWPLQTSSPERAILEALDELPEHESFHSIDVAFESLTTLSPKKLSALLAQCKSVKVKRLFFVFADRHAHTWRKHVQPKSVDLGAGDRSLVKGGKLHTQYRITVPPEYAAPRQEAGSGT